jgi:hypothetical protein
MKVPIHKYYIPRSGTTKNITGPNIKHLLLGDKNAQTLQYPHRSSEDTTLTQLWPLTT